MSDDRRKALISGGQAVAFDRWQSPAVGPGPGGSHGLSINDLEAIQKDAYDEAYTQGLAEGRAVGERECRDHASRLCAMLDVLAAPFEELDDSVEQQVLQLAMVVARNIVRRELKTDPAHVIGAVREALKILPIAARDVRVQLHPEDAEIIRTHLKPAEGERAWHVVENPVLTRGGCRVETDSSRIDASVESRLAKLMAVIVGDERDSGERRQSEPA